MPAAVLPFLESVLLDPLSRPELSRAYLTECVDALDIPPPLSAITGLLDRPEVIEAQHVAKKRKLEVNGASRELKSPRPAPVLATLIEKPFDKAQLTAMHKEGLSRGRAQKHAGDAHHRSSAAADQHQGILELADALLVYVYAFWCDDHLKGRVVDGVSKPACEKGNWQSIFPMLKYTRDIARDAGQGWEAIVGLANLLEGLVLEHMTHYARRQLHNRIDTSQKNKDSHSTEGHTPRSIGPSPPSASSHANHEETEEQIKSFLKLSIDMEAKARLLNAALFASDAPLSNVNFGRLLPELYAKAAKNETPLAAQVDLRGGTDARWSWPIDLTNGPNALAHAAAFGRAVLEQVAEQQDLKGWRGVSIRAPLA